MRGLGLLFLCSILVVTSSCSNSQEKKLEIKDNMVQILFFSDESNYTVEAPYYDALIELKARYPEEIRNMLVVTSNQVYLYRKTYKINSIPALLVIYNNNTLVKIDGEDVSKEEIIQPVANVLMSTVGQKSP